MIQRVIDQNGSSTYKIDDGKSRPRPLRRIELDSILITLGIMLDNPVAVLNQETARSFLRSKDPRDKYVTNSDVDKDKRDARKLEFYKLILIFRYHLFYEGTTLAKCERVLNESKENIEATKQNFKRAREVSSNPICI